MCWNQTIGGGRGHCGNLDPAGWADEFDELFAQVVAPFFGRREPRVRARSYLLGLLSGVERKNGWSLAEFAGDATPDGMQRLLNHARWDADQVRDALRAQVAERLGDPGGVLVVDDTLALLGPARSVWTLVAVAFVVGTFDTVFETAAPALLPDLVQQENLYRANGYLFAAEAVGLTLVGPPLGGWLIAVAEPAPPLLSMLTFLASAACVLAIRGTFRQPRPERTAGVAAEVTQGCAGWPVTAGSAPCVSRRDY